MINEDECDAAGLDIKEVKKIANGLSRYGRMADKLGLFVFGGSGTGQLRIDIEGRPLVLADLDGVFDGGDGACAEDENGLLRGE